MKVLYLFVFFPACFRGSMALSPDFLNDILSGIMEGESLMRFWGERTPFQCQRGNSDIRVIFP